MARFYLCRHCGDMHQRGRTPDNCKDEAPPRNWRLAAPMITPPFRPFLASPTEGIYIDDRRARRDFMERRDLVDYEPSVDKAPEPTEREWREEFAQDLERAIQTDPLNRPPVEVIGRTDTEGAGEIDTEGMEVFK